MSQVWNDYDFFFVHIKKTDSYGEDGNFDAKVHVIETVDEALPELLKLNPDVLIITGDHSTPAKLKSHSWHPVPFLLWAPDTIRPDTQTQFGERACAMGGLGTINSLEAMPLALGARAAPDQVRRIKFKKINTPSITDMEGVFLCGKRCDRD